MSEVVSFSSSGCCLCSCCLTKVGANAPAQLVPREETATAHVADHDAAEPQEKMNVKTLSTHELVWRQESSPSLSGRCKVWILVVARPTSPYACNRYTRESSFASAGNRTRVTSMATMYSATRPRIPLCKAISLKTTVAREGWTAWPCFPE